MTQEEQNERGGPPRYTLPQIWTKEFHPYLSHEIALQCEEHGIEDCYVTDYYEASELPPEQQYQRSTFVIVMETKWFMHEMYSTDPIKRVIERLATMVREEIEVHELREIWLNPSWITSNVSCETPELPAALTVTVTVAHLRGNKYS